MRRARTSATVSLRFAAMDQGAPPQDRVQATRRPHESGDGQAAGKRARVRPAAKEYVRKPPDSCLTRCPLCGAVDLTGLISTINRIENGTLPSSDHDPGRILHMRLIQYRDEAGARRVGAVSEDGN